MADPETRQGGSVLETRVPEQFLDKTLERYRGLSRPIRYGILAMTVLGIVFAVNYIFGPVPMLDTTYYFLLMAMFLPLVFLLTPAHKGEKRVAWYSYLLALIALGVMLFLSTKGYALMYQSWIPPNNWQYAVAAVVFLLVLEAARRSGGTIFLCIVGGFSLYPVVGERMPGILWAPPSPLDRTLAFNVYSNDALLGIVTRVVGETLIGFLLLAALLVATGAAEFFLKLALALMGKARGGPAKVAVVASGFFGSLSGSIFANVVGTGSVTIPSMKRSGFPNHYAGALEACASTGGMLMPPVMGAVAFIMADFTSTEYAVIAIAAIIPSLLYYFGLYCHVDSYAAKAGLAGLQPAELPSLRKTLQEGWPFLVVLAFLTWGLVYMRWERLAPFYASALLIVLTLFKKELRLTAERVFNVVFEAGKLLSQTMALLLPTSFILGGLMATGVAPVITAELMRVGTDNLVLVLGIGVIICMIFGMLGMIIAAYLMLALTLVPAVEQIAGLNTLAVHLFIAYYSTLAAITPPVALAAFIASRISDSDPIQTSWHAARMGIVIYFIPFFFLFEPALIFQGPIYRTLVWLFLNIVAVLLIAGASEGYLVRFGPLRTWARWVLFVAGLLIGFPEWTTTVAGGIGAAAVLTMARLSRSAGPGAGATAPAAGQRT